MDKFRVLLIPSNSIEIEHSLYSFYELMNRVLSH